MSRCLSSALQSRSIYCLSTEVCVNALFWPEIGSEPVPLLQYLFPVVSWPPWGARGCVAHTLENTEKTQGVCGRLPGGTAPEKLRKAAQEHSDGCWESPLLF